MRVLRQSQHLETGWVKMFHHNTGVMCPLGGLDGSDGWFFSLTYSSDFHHIRDREGTTKKLRAKEYAELSGEFSGAICLKTLVFFLGNTLDVFRKFFGAVRAMFWLSGSFLAPDSSLNV